MNPLHEKLERLPLVGIMRGFQPRLLAPILHAMRKGGLQILEVTMNSPAATAQIRAALDLAGEAMAIGAGTVTSVALLHEALDAGAQFVVTPTLNLDVVRACVARNIPIFPGALSPSEVWTAWEAGAAMVKIFPAEIGGPACLKALREAFPEVKLMPTGGVDPVTLPAFIAAGASGAGIGSPLFDRARIEAGDFAWLEKRAAQFAAAWRTNPPPPSP